MLKTLVHKLLGKKKEPVSTPAPQERRPRVKQVYEGPRIARPDFAEGVEESDLIEVLQQHVKCRYKPHIEYQRIYKPGRRKVGGDLDTVYDGIAASCAAIKQFAAKVAEEDGLIQGYRYVDLNHIFACCCGNPERCRFYQLATGEQATVAGRQRRNRIG